MKTISVVFTVSGRRNFPIDMLRYDACIPASENDANKIINTFDHGRHIEPTTIECRREIEGVRRHTYPTVGRWQSFGWTVTQICIDGVTYRK